MRMLSSNIQDRYRLSLVCEEKAVVTVEKYTRDVAEFADWLAGRPVTREAVLEYKANLVRRYAPASVNAALSSLNGFFRFAEWHDLRVRSLRIQRQIFTPADRELARAEYDSLVQAAKRRGDRRLYLLLQTVCATGIRVSEVRHITVEAAARGVAEIVGKGKRRQVFLPGGLCRSLMQYAEEEGIGRGAVFVTRNGNPLDRSNVWSDMKRLCRAAGVAEGKVFPHNLRHLFARTYYAQEKDVVRLADLLGHASVNTTRIYTRESGEIHRKQIESLGLLDSEI